MLIKSKNAHAQPVRERDDAVHDDMQRRLSTLQDEGAVRLNDGQYACDTSMNNELQALLTNLGESAPEAKRRGTE